MLNLNAYNWEEVENINSKPARKMIKEIFNQNVLTLNERKGEDDLMKSYTLSLEKGDEILMGKYRNKKAEIKGFSLDKHNQPIMHTNKGNRKMTAFRVADKMPEESAQDKYHAFLKKKLKEFGKSSFKKLSSDEKKELSDEWKKEKKVE